MILIFGFFNHEEIGSSGFPITSEKICSQTISRIIRYSILYPSEFIMLEKIILVNPYKKVIQKQIFDKEISSVFQSKGSDYLMHLRPLLKNAIIISGTEENYNKALTELNDREILFLTEDINYSIAKILLRTQNEMVGLYSRRDYFNKVLPEIVKEVERPRLYIQTYISFYEKSKEAYDSPLMLKNDFNYIEQVDRKHMELLIYGFHQDESCPSEVKFDLFQLYRINKRALISRETPFRLYYISDDEYIVDQIVSLFQKTFGFFIPLELKDINSAAYRSHKNIYIQNIDELDYIKRKNLWVKLIANTDSNIIITSKTDLLPENYSKYFEKKVLSDSNETEYHFSKLIAALITERWETEISHIQNIMIELNSYKEIFPGIPKLSKFVKALPSQLETPSPLSNVYFLYKLKLNLQKDKAPENINTLFTKISIVRDQKMWRISIDDNEPFETSSVNVYVFSLLIQYCKKKKISIHVKTLYCLSNYYRKKDFDKKLLSEKEYYNFCSNSINRLNDALKLLYENHFNYKDFRYSLKSPDSIEFGEFYPILKDDDLTESFLTSKLKIEKKFL